MTAPEGETPKERRNQWIVGIASVVALLSLLGNLALGVLVTKDQQALGTKDTQIVGLLKQHSATFAQQKKQAKQTNIFLEDLGLLATYLIESNEAVCEASHAACPTLPTLPKVPGS